MALLSLSPGRGAPAGGAAPAAAAAPDDESAATLEWARQYIAEMQRRGRFSQDIWSS